MADHDDALIEKAAQAVMDSLLAARIINPKTHTVWTDWRPEAIAVLDAVADDLRQEGARAERVRADRELATYDADLATIEDRDEWKARADTHREVAESMTAKWQEELQRADSLERMNDALADRRANHEPWHCCCAEGSHSGQADALNRMKARAEQAEAERDTLLRLHENANEGLRLTQAALDDAEAELSDLMQQQPFRVARDAQRRANLAEAALSRALADVERARAAGCGCQVGQYDSREDVTCDIHAALDELLAEHRDRA